VDKREYAKKGIRNECACGKLEVALREKSEGECLN